jgi:hypothetical protein
LQEAVDLLELQFVDSVLLLLVLQFMHHGLQLLLSLLHLAFQFLGLDELSLALCLDLLLQHVFLL